MFDLNGYLAGLIEADGSIIIHDPLTKARWYNPRIIIVFSLKDQPLAVKLCELLNMGFVYKGKGSFILWKIQKQNDVLAIINIINGFMRTPKIEALGRAIDWFNKNRGYSLFLKPLDDSPIDSNSWLAGFTDGDGNFSITITKRKNKGYRIQTFFRIEVKQNYHRGEDLNKSFFPVLGLIAAFLKVNIYSRVRSIKNKLYYSFIIISHNKISHGLTTAYFSKFPLLSSKRLAFIDWCKVHEICNDSVNLTEIQLNKIRFIKSNFNSKRKFFNWSHLDDLKLP